MREGQRLFDDQKSGLHAIVRNAVPHHARASHRHGVPEFDFLAGVQGRIRMNGAETTRAVVHKMAGYFLWRRIGE